MNVDLIAEPAACIFLNSAENLLWICLQLVDGIGIGRVEWKGDHRLLFAEVDADHTVVIGYLSRKQLTVVFRTVVGLVVAAHLIVGDPD